MKCPCDNSREYADCCGPVLSGERKATTAEEVMRARYSAYASGNVDFIIDSQSPEGREAVDRKATEEWSRHSEWLGLEILRTEQGTAEDEEGVVEFMAHYELQGETVDHHEIAHFRREDDQWYFVDGLEVKPRPYRRAEPKVGPNSPCPCGSGKKYKKCHGQPGAAGIA